MMWDLPLPLAGPVSIPAPPIVPIKAGSVSNVASIDIPWGDQQFDRVHVLVDQWSPASTSQPDIFTSSDGGATFDAGATDYRAQGVVNNVTTVSGYSAVQSSIQLGHDVGDLRMLGGTAIACFLVTVWRPFDAAELTVLEGWGGYDHDVLSTAQFLQGSGFREAAGKVNAVRLAATVGNVSARYVAWGVLP